MEERRVNFSTSSMHPFSCTGETPGDDGFCDSGGGGNGSIGVIVFFPLKKERSVYTSLLFWGKLGGGKPYPTELIYT